MKTRLFRSPVLSIISLALLFLLLGDGRRATLGNTYNGAEVQAVPSITSVILSNIDSAEFLLGLIVGAVGVIWRVKPQEKLNALEERQKALIRNQSLIYDTLIQLAETNSQGEEIIAPRQLDYDREKHSGDITPK